MTEYVIMTDGDTSVARLYKPWEPAKGAALIVPTMGVAQTYYAAFATWLCN